SSRREYLNQPVAASIPLDAAQASAAAAATAAAEAAVGALPPEGTAAAAEAAAALGGKPYSHPGEEYSSARDRVIPREERRIPNLGALLVPQQDIPLIGKVREQLNSCETEQNKLKICNRFPSPQQWSPNLEDYIVLRKDDPRAIYLRDHLLQLEQQAAKDAALAAASAAATTLAPSNDPNVVGEAVVGVSTDRSPFSRDDEPRILKGVRAELAAPLKVYWRIWEESRVMHCSEQVEIARKQKEDVIAEFLEQQRLEAIEKEKERQTEAEQAKIRKQLIEKQLAQHREKESAAAAAASDAAAESQQEVTQDELPPGWQIGIRVPTEENQVRRDREEGEESILQDHQTKEEKADPRAHFDTQPIDVRKPRPHHRGSLINDPRLADFSPISRVREVAPSAILRESKSVRQAVPEFPEF
ncbi:hypothetical protein PMAYCL1PPCAC_29892, partial [Pristionchus mayeri]